MEAITKKLVNNLITEIINPVIIFAFAIAVLFLIWNISKYVRNAADSKEREKAVQQIFWGVVGLAIMIAAFGIIGVVTNVFSLTEAQAPVDAINPFVK